MKYQTEYVSEDGKQYVAGCVSYRAACNHAAKRSRELDLMVSVIAFDSKGVHGAVNYICGKRDSVEGRIR